MLFNTALWSGVLLLGYVATRAFCLVVLPGDCKQPGNFLSLAALAILGLLQGYLTRVILDGRFRKLSWLGIFFLAIPAFSLISELPLLEMSIVSDSDVSEDYALALILIFSGILISILFHVWLTFKVLSFRDFLKFWLWRWFGGLCVVGLYLAAHWRVGWHYTVHLHHYFLAWAISLVAAVKNSVSDAYLAITCAIFVQGLAAYSADPILIPGNF